MPSPIAHPIFSRETVNSILKPKVLERMKWSLLGKDKATIGEVVAIEEAFAFAVKWTAGDETVFFTVEETAKHCNAVLNIAERHFTSNPR